MKLIILAAGTGSRLGAEISKNPKSLLKIGNTTLIERLIKQFWKYNIKNINIIIGYKGNKIKKKIGNKYNFIDYPNFKKTNNLHTLWHARNILNESVVITFADLLVEDKIIKKVVKSKKKIILAVDSSKVREGTMFVKHSKNKLLKITNLKKSEATGNFIGIAKIHSSKINNFLNFLKRNLDKKKDYYTVVLNDMIKKNVPINIIDIKKLFWSEIDTKQDLNLTIKKYNSNSNKFLI